MKESFDVVKIAAFNFAKMKGLEGKWEKENLHLHVP